MLRHTHKRDPDAKNGDLRYLTYLYIQSDDASRNVTKRVLLLQRQLPIISYFVIRHTHIVNLNWFSFNSDLVRCHS